MIDVNRVKLTTTVFVLLAASGCSWVDSTGKQDSSESITVNPLLVNLNNNDSFQINENTQQSITFNGRGNRIRGWTWNLLEGQASFDQCQGIDGFDQSIATNSLSQSCADGNNCELVIEELTLGDVTQFAITTPELRSPAALRLSFTAESESGLFVEQQQTMCAVAINNPPMAMDDPITILRGTWLEVTGDSPKSLLANDSDDNDVRNQPLVVDPTPVKPPRFARSFELFTDGGFIYEPLITAPISMNGSISDNFTYLVSDGNSTSMATVSIKIMDFNSPPAQDDDLPEITVTVNDDDRDPEIAYLQSFFSDAENDALEFSVTDGSLPQSGNLYITNDGVLEGFAEEDDSGLYVVNMTVSDSLDAIDASFFLTVLSDRNRNRSPSVSDIRNATVTDEFSYDVSVYFDDADDDHLYFTAINLPPGVEISPTGVIEGTSTSANQGNWLIRVTADDGNGGTTDDGFRLRIR